LPKPSPDGAVETLGMLLVRFVSTSCPACGGMTTVKLSLFFSVPVLVPPTDPEICRLCTWCEDTSDRNWE
jgi:hypothetical protein